MTAPTLVGAVDGLRPHRDLAPTRLGACARFGLSGRTLSAYDAQMRVSASRRLRVKGEPKLLVASADLTDCLLSGPDALWHCRGRKRSRIAVPQADAAVLLENDRALVTAPEVLTTDGGQHHRGTHYAHLVDLAETRVLHRVEMPAADAGAFLTPHPSGTFLADLGEGQDGSTLYELTVDSGTLEVREALTDVVAADVHPTHGHLLLTPHPSFSDAGVRVVSWPRGDTLASLRGSDLGLDDAFQLYGAYLGPDRILVTTYESGMFVTDDVLGHPTRLEFPDDVGDPESFLVTDEHHFVGSHWTDGADRSLVWRL